MRASQLLLPLLIVVALYFLFLRPQRTRQRAAQQLASSIEPGQRVVTTAGMYATVVEIDDAGVLLEIAPGVEVRYVRQAISRVVDNELVAEPVDGAPIDEEYADDEYASDEDASDEYAEDGTEGGTEGGQLGDDEQAAGPGGGATAVDLSKGRDGTVSDPARDPADPARR